MKLLVVISVKKYYGSAEMAGQLGAALAAHAEDPSLAPTVLIRQLQGIRRLFWPQKALYSCVHTTCRHTHTDTVKNLKIKRENK